MILFGGKPRDTYTSQQAASAANDAAAAKREVNELNMELARMKLVCAAMWELVKEKTNLTEDDIIARMAVIDAKDGVADGRLLAAPKKCVDCGRPVTPRQGKCIYCGKVQPIESVFETI